MSIVKEKTLENGIYEVKDGEIEPITKPLSGFGKQVISWEAGKITRKEISFIEK